MLLEPSKLWARLVSISSFVIYEAEHTPTHNPFPFQTTIAMDPSTSAAALKAEIARLTGNIFIKRFLCWRHLTLSTGAIEQRKIAEANARTSAYSSRPRGNVYINPNYKPPSRSAPTARPVSRPPIPPVTANAAPKEVVIGGVAFQSSGRSLVRKDRK